MGISVKESREKRPKRIKQKTAKKRSSIARDLHSSKYRQRIVEAKELDTDLLLEEGLEEYYKEAQPSHTHSPSDQSLQKIPSTTSTGTKEPKAGQT